MEFLITDVSTGDRGSGIGSDAGAAKRRPTTFSAICDPFGLHLRFEAYFDNAADIAAQLVAAGSYEGYLAPGANQPYLCFLINMQTGKLQLWNTTYDNPHHTRITLQNTSLWRHEHRPRPDGFTTHLFLSWDAYADKLPEATDIWDFETAQWGQGSYSWNGLKSIHGRSSWGELTFEIQPE